MNNFKKSVFGIVVIVLIVFSTRYFLQGDDIAESKAVINNAEDRTQDNKGKMVNIEDEIEHLNVASSLATVDAENMERTQQSSSSSISDFLKSQISDRSYILSEKVASSLDLSETDRKEIRNIMQNKMLYDNNLSDLLTAIIISETPNNQNLTAEEQENFEQRIQEKISIEIGDKWEENRRSYEGNLRALLPSEKVEEYRDFEQSIAKQEQVSSINAVVESTLKHVDDLSDYQKQKIESIGQAYIAKDLPEVGLGAYVSPEHGGALLSNPEQLNFYSEFQESVLNVMSPEQQKRYVAELSQSFRE